MFRARWKTPPKTDNNDFTRRDKAGGRLNQVWSIRNGQSNLLLLDIYATPIFFFFVNIIKEKENEHLLASGNTFDIFE